MAAKRKGLMPAFLNLSKLVSAPNAAMAMVRRKVSSWLIQFTMLSGSKPRELNPITIRKRMANHGMLILGLENIHADYEKGIVALVHDESHINKYFRTHDCKVLSAEYCFPEEWITCDFSPKIIFRDKVKLDPYFNKGRDYSLKGKLKKTVSVIYRAIRWYL